MIDTLARMHWGTIPAVQDTHQPGADGTDVNGEVRAAATCLYDVQTDSQHPLQRGASSGSVQYIRWRACAGNPSQPVQNTPQLGADGMDIDSVVRAAAA